MRQFYDLCPETAIRETRTIITFKQSLLPDDEYGFVDFYCDEPDCDCRRSTIQVRAKNQGLVATLSYGWESLEFYEKWYRAPSEEITGVTLAPTMPQSKYADKLLELFKETLLNDPEYASRFPRHYRQFKAAITAKSRATKPRSRRRTISR